MRSFGRHAVTLASILASRSCINWNEPIGLPNCRRSCAYLSLTDPRFAEPAKLAANMDELTAILDGIFSAKPMAHWREVFDKTHVTYGMVRDPSDVINDPQLRENGIVVPLEGADGKLTSTISSPMQVHDIAKVPAKRAPELGEHNDEVLEALVFDAKQIDALRANGAIGMAKGRAA